MKNRTSLIGRLIRWQIIAMALAWSGLLLWIVYSMLGYSSGDLDRRMLYFSKILAETATVVGPAQSSAGAQFEVAANTFSKVVVKSLEKPEKYVETYQILSPKNEVLYRSAAAPQTPMLLMPGFADVVVAGEGHRAVRVQSMDGTVVVVLAESDAFRLASMLPLIKGISASLVLIFIVCIFVLWWVARRSFLPVTLLAKKLSRREAGDLTPLDNSTTYTEIAPLVTELNGLLAREAARLDLERGFLADAAHELRTPLAAMSAQAHLLLQAPDKDSRYSAALRLQAGLQRVSHLMSQLLAIARVDASDAYSRAEVINAAELLRQCIAEHIPAAQCKSIAVGLDAPDEVTLLVSKAGFTSIVDNLIDNSLRYTGRGGNVAVSLSVKPSGCELAIKDDGPGIALDLREKVFERFFRGPGIEADGSGLGLAIVRKIATGRGASVRLGDGLGGRGLSVTLLFPVSY